MEAAKNIQAPVSIAPGSKAWASRIRRRAKELVEGFDTGYMELSQILYEVWDTPAGGDPNAGPVYKDWGFDSFADYAEKELNLHRRKAERLRLIWYTLEISLAGMDPALRDRLVHLGASKLRDLVRVLTLENAEAWCRRAEGCGYPQLCADIRKSVRDAEIARLQKEVSASAAAQEAPEIVVSGGGAPSGEGAGFDDGRDDGGPSVVRTSTACPLPDPEEELQFEHFSLYPAQRLNVKLALKKAGELCGSDKKSHQLDLICTDFLANNDIVPKNVAENRVRFLARMERVFGVKLIALDEAGKEVVYGLGLLERLAKGDGT